MINPYFFDCTNDKYTQLHAERNNSEIFVFAICLTVCKGNVPLSATEAVYYSVSTPGVQQGAVDTTH